MSMPFDPAKIQIDTPPFTVFEVLRKIERGHIELNPDFQRNFIWSAQQQSRLVESILLKIPLPTFYLDATSQDRWQVVDGLQRLTTLVDFCKTKRLHLSGLDFLVNLNGKGFDDLPDMLQRTIEDTKLTLITIQPGTPRNVKFLIFRRINTGGVNLNDQEIRHGVFEGSARDFLRDLATSPEFLAATNQQVDTKRMEDRECVLRYMAFRLNPYGELAFTPGESLVNFDELLNQTMEELNQYPISTRNQHAENFYASMRKAHEVFGELAFCEVQEQLETGPFRKALFEVWSVLLHDYTTEALQPESIKKRIIDASIAAMTNNAAFLAAIQPGADDRQSILTRFNTVDQILRTILG